MTGFDGPWLSTGYASTLRSIGSEFIKRGHTVYSICGNFIFETDGAIISDEGIIVLSNKGCNLYPDKDMFLKHYNDILPDVVIAHNDFYRISYISELEENILNKTLVWLPIEDCHGFGDLGQFSKLKNLAFVTPYGQNLYKNILPSTKLFQINHQVNADFCDNSKIDRNILDTMDLVKDKFIVLRVDRNQDRKKWELTLKSFEKFIKKYYIEDAVLVAKTRKADFVSDLDLGKYAQELGILDKIVFIDEDLNQHQLRGLHDASDIFFSTTGSEGFGLSIAEAMISCKPIIYTGCAPLFDVVGPNNGTAIRVLNKKYSTKMFVQYNEIDTDHACEILNEYYQDWKSGKTRIKSEGLSARKYAKRYEVESVVDKFEEVFEQMKIPYEKIAIAIATKNRPVPLTALLTSIFNQTYKNYDIFICDNSDNEDVIHTGALMKQIDLFKSYGHNIGLWKNPISQNAPDSHNQIFQSSKTLGYKYIFKLDDDCILEENVLENLMNIIQSDEKIGAVGCSILNPATSKIHQTMPDDYPSQTINNLTTSRQWTWKTSLQDEQVEHLHSSFIYSTKALDEIGGFPQGLSKVAFREETLATYPMALMGWKLIYSPNSIIWHMKSEEGGCRDNNIEDLYRSDDEIFFQRLRELQRGS